MLSILGAEYGTFTSYKTLDFFCVYVYYTHCSLLSESGGIGRHARLRI